MMNHIFETAVSLFDSILCIYFIMKFHNSSWRKSKFAIPAILLHFVVTLIGDFASSDISMVITIALLAIAILYAFTICGKHYIRAVITACIQKMVVILSATLVINVFALFFEDFQAILYASGSMARYFAVITQKVLLVAILSFLVSIFAKDDYWEVKNAVWVLAVSFATIFGIGAAMLIATAPGAEDLEVQIVVIAAAFVLVDIAVYVLIAQVQKLQKSKYELQLLQEKEKFEKERYKDISVMWENIRKVQHDMKQHLTVISCQLESGEVEKCQQYVDNLLPNINYTNKLVRTENEVLDYMINAKLGALEDTEIYISGMIVDLSDIRPMDLACLFGNILDNAIEAVRDLDDKRIELIFELQNASRVIICRNTIAESVLKHNKDLESTKSSKGRHSLGHKIIEKVVKEYEGIVEFFEEDGMFGVEILLPIPDELLMAEREDE